MVITTGSLQQRAMTEAKFSSDDAIASSAALRALRHRLKKPVVLVGLMGVGKSTVGRKLAQLLHLPFVDADHEIEAASRMKITEIFERFGEASFRDGERRVIARLIQGEPKVIATGGGAFVDPDTRSLVLDKAIAIWLDGDIDILFERVSRRNTRPLLNTGNPRETLERLAQERTPFYAQAPIRVASENAPHGQTVQRCISALEAYL